MYMDMKEDAASDNIRRRGKREEEWKEGGGKEGEEGKEGRGKRGREECDSNHH